MDREHTGELLNGSGCPVRTRRTCLLQEWTTIRSAVTSTFVQDESHWLDVGGFADAVFWIDVSAATPPGGTGTNYVKLTLESAPTCDHAYFQPVASPIWLGTGTTIPVRVGASTPFVVKSARGPGTPALSRYLRWRIDPVGAGAWDLTFRIRAVLGRGGFFAPTQLPGCALWLRSDLGITLNGSNVSGWSDQSGNGVNAAQATGGSQPPYVLNAMNALPALRGDGVNYFMTTSAFTLGSAATLFVAAQPLTGTQPSYARLIEQQHLATYYLGVTQAGTGYKLIVNNNVYPYGVADGGAVGSGANTIVTGLYSSPTGSLYVNGAQVASDTFTAPTATSLPLYLMRVYSGAGGFWNGYFAEAIVYNRALSIDERTSVHRYLGARYGIVMP